MSLKVLSCSLKVEKMQALVEVHLVKPLVQDFSVTFFKRKQYRVALNKKRKRKTAEKKPILFLILQGRCTPMSQSEEEKEEEENADEEEKEKDDAEDEEGDDEKDDDEIEIFEAIRETSVPLLRTIADDKAIGRLDPWIVSLSSKLLVEKAIIILRSNLWPGAYTFYDGKIFDHIYIGYGFKYSAFHYAPPIYVPWQKEYKVGTEVIEHVDEPFASQTEETNVQKNSDEETEDNKEEEE
ncbi:radial spoke head protein 6 homolog A-like [Uloborus diversus]|uniref:radial spoke head protein 6 homolog A-like n=1 Tax=Uloborus diversus TaxID=327109 RepID=UPI00240A234C|nr:radial spoke head protein 6 homolog A-like [Uloborus diversus]